MKKIKSLFKRDYQGNRTIINEVVEGSEWVINNEGKSTRKYDGTAVMIKNGELYKRYDVKKGRPIPEIGIPCEPEPNEHTGHWPWWIPVGKGNEDKWHREAYNKESDGTYELVGLKINGNREKFDNHQLVNHGEDILENVPRNYEGLRIYFQQNYIEGIVWHHPDGRMVKIKRKDFGFKW